MSAHKLVLAGLVAAAVTTLPASPVQAQPRGHAASASTVASANCSAAALVRAINAANASPGPSTIRLARKCVYRLTTPAPNDPANGLPAIRSDIRIDGQGATITRAKGAPRFRILAVAEGGTLTISRVTITNGSATDCPLFPGQAVCGGGISNLGTLNAANITVRYNTATSNLPAEGGGIDSDGRATLTDVDISYNTARYTGTEVGSADGGGLANDGLLTVRHSLVAGNSVSVTPNTGSFAFGSGQASFADARIERSTYAGNRAIATGGFARAAVTVADPATLSVDDTVVRDNTAEAAYGEAQGGAIAGNAHVTVTRSRITGNQTVAPHGIARGAGLRIPLLGVLRLSDTTVSNNTARATGSDGRAEGAGIDNPLGGSVTVVRSWITNNTAYAPQGISRGGGLFNAIGTSTLTDSSVTGNRAGDGGGIFKASGTVTLNNTAVRRNVPNNCSPAGSVPGCSG
ncbi:hypothetical protein [Streptomyces sp. NPDC005209]|uniref:hypothetical protein n=1 Tax=Streptomyces sp. NPDC005209 TaxID=3156715 RepID=UPI0033AEF9C7